VGRRSRLGRPDQAQKLGTLAARTSGCVKGTRFERTVNLNSEELKVYVMSKPHELELNRKTAREKGGKKTTKNSSI
jgi:hypothetical protein